MSRSYDQFCALARALDLVGGRWTLLLVRELLFGPRRYKDLLENLPGIGTNLLAARLRELESEGVVRRTELPPPASAMAYELTERGQGLGDALIELARWGMDPIEPPRAGDEQRPGWYLLAMRAAFRAEQAAGIGEAYELRIDGETFRVRVDDGTATIAQGSAEAPAVVVECETPALLAMLTGELSPADAERRGICRIEGSRKALGRFLRLFALPAPVAPTRR